MTRLYYFLLCFAPIPLIAQVIEQDSLALVELYQATNGDQWNQNENWLTGKVGDWFGITVENNRVVRLELYDNNLTGDFPVEIMDLEALRYLELSSNSLTGPIPSSMGNLTSLQYFGASSNMLTGTIPESIGNCAELNDLSIADNQIEGTFPSSLVNCTKLIYLSAHKNLLTGEFPEVLLDMPQLEQIILENNQFSGQVPPEINNMTNLHTLDILRNEFSGPFPKIDELEKINSLHLDGNDFTGNMDTILGYHPNMYYFTVSSNRFTGTIAHSHFNSGRLEYAHWQYNDFDAMEDWSVFADTGVLFRIYVDGNRLDFDDLEPNAQLNATIYTYADQAKLGMPDTIHLGNGDAYTLESTMQSPAILYQWYFNGDSIPGANESSLEITDFDAGKSGYYSFDARHPGLPDLTLQSHDIYLLSTSGMQTLDPDSWAVFPNPAHEYFVVEMKDIATMGTITLFDASGRKMLRKKAEQRSIIPLERLPSGSYTVCLEIEGEAGVRKLLIQR